MRLLLTIGFVIFLTYGSIADAQIACPADLWKGLIAEATSEGRDGMYAVCCVVRNRLDKGMNSGLCGLGRKNLDAFVKREGKSREVMAKEIVDEVFSGRGRDVTDGATHFENVQVYGWPSWARDMVVTIKIGQHTFFKERR